MIAVVHKLLYSGGEPGPVRKMVHDEAKRVALLGGRYSIEQVYISNWFEYVTIWYPDNEKVPDKKV